MSFWEDFTFSNFPFRVSSDEVGYSSPNQSITSVTTCSPLSILSDHKAPGDFCWMLDHFQPLAAVVQVNLILATFTDVVFSTFAIPNAQTFGQRPGIWMHFGAQNQ